MEPQMSLIETVLWGAFGGLAAEAINWYSLRHLPPSDYPYWVRSPLYYLIAMAMVAVAAVVTLAYARSGTTLNPLLAIQIGASAPLIIRRGRDVLAPKVEAPDPSRID
jgi:hypothetical protein